MKLGVIGAGAWGTAFAIHLAKQGYKISLWCYENKTAENITKGENNDFLPGIEIPKLIKPTTQLSTVVEGAKAIFFAVPVQNLASVVSRISPHDISKAQIFISLSKGIERSTGKLPSQIIDEALKIPLKTIALSGPSFADEVTKERPTVMVAAGNIQLSRDVRRIVASDYLRAYSSDDRVGVELSAALKNVLALASGMSDGLGLGENARSALIVRGLAEMQRLTLALGANPQTAFGIAGLGDLVLTCTSGKSRNYRFGQMLAQGNPASKIISLNKWVAEGVFTAKAALELAKKHGVELPITEQVSEVIEENKTPLEVSYALMTRPLKDEFPK